MSEQTSEVLLWIRHIDTVVRLRRRDVRLSRKGNLGGLSDLV
jgi:hypothetical protein